MLHCPRRIWHGHSEYQLEVTVDLTRSKKADDRSPPTTADDEFNETGAHDHGPFGWVTGMEQRSPPLEFSGHQIRSKGRNVPLEEGCVATVADAPGHPRSLLEAPVRAATSE